MVTACERNVVDACVEASAMFFQGTGGGVDGAAARQYATKACEFDSGRGWYFLASIVNEGVGGSKDVAETVRLVRKACKLGEDKACRRLDSQGVPRE